MALGVAIFDPMLDTASANAVTASMHTTNGSTTGADEVTGTGYARQAITWDPASGGQVDATGQITFTIPGGFTVNHLGLWDSGGAWLGSIKLSTEESYGAEGTYTVLLLRITQSDVSPA